MRIFFILFPSNFLAERSGAHWGARAPHQAQQAGKEWRARRARPQAAGGADLGVPSAARAPTDRRRRESAAAVITV